MFCYTRPLVCWVRRLRFQSPLLGAGCRDFLVPDDDVTDLRRLVRQHQTGAHAESTDRVTVHIAVGDSDRRYLSGTPKRGHPLPILQLFESFEVC